MKFLFSPKGWMPTFLLIFIISSFNYAQITIEERVEIEPQSVAYSPNNPTSSHTIRIEMQWTPETTPAAALGYSLPCQSAGGTAFETGGNLTYLIENVSAGGHSLQFRFNIPCTNPELVIGQYQIFLDDQLVQSNSFFVGGCYSGSSYPFYNFSYTPPLVSNFSFNLNNNESCVLTPTPMAISTFNDCTTGISWNSNTQPVNLTFTSGGEFASFYDMNSQLIGNNFSGTFSEFQDINIIQDSVYRGSEDKYFIVQCEWGGIVKTDSVKLRTQTGDIIVANPDEDSLYTGQTVNIEVYPNDFGGECTIFFPFEATYNAEIVEGNEYGNLIDPNTGEHVQSFTELFQLFGYAYFNYVADGISPDTVKSVIIRISSSDPKIPYTDLTLYIKPPPIFVYTVPEVVSASDTADVIIKKRNADGTLEDFPPGQTFELAVLDGCVNGNIMVDDSVGVYFADALQPIKFVTADSLESDSGFVRLRVGTDVSGFMGLIGNVIGEEEKQLTERRRELVGDSGYNRSELRAAFYKMMDRKKAERLAENIKTGGEPSPEAPIIEACYIGGSSHPVYWEGNAKYEKGGTLDHFEITIIPDTLAEKDTLAFGETAKLIVQAKDADDNDVELQSDKLLTFKVETNENYGTFIDENGDTLISSPVVLSNITYQNAKDGLIKFAAVKANPDSVIKCLIKVVLEEGTTKNGERDAVVLEHTFKIIIDAPLEVEPIITRRKYDENHRDYITNTTDVNIKQFNVKLTRGGKFVHNHKFILSTNYVSGFGGHDHLEPLRLQSSERLIWQNYGRFYSYQTDSTKNPLIENTPLDTILNRFNYIASIWGDTMKIYVKSVYNFILKDSIEIIERIDSLNRLEPDENYILIGGTEEHNGPQAYQDDHNHFGTDDLRMHLLDISIDYRAQLPDEPLLNINDISLPFGGKFDINGQWRGSHVDHRTGRNVDIRNRDMEGDRYDDTNNNGTYDPDPIHNPDEMLLYDGNGNGIYDGETLEIFKDICEDNDASRVLLENPWNHNEYSEHWHLTF